MIRKSKPTPKTVKRSKSVYSPSEFKNEFVNKGGVIKRKNENDVQLELCLWIDESFDLCLYCSDIAGRNLSKAQRDVYMMRSKSDKLNDKGERSALSFPDLLIYNKAGIYNGLALEIKDDGLELMNSKGELKSQHLKDQLVCLKRFEAQGWAVSFGVGLEACKRLILDYLRGDWKGGEFVNF